MRGQILRDGGQRVVGIADGERGHGIARPFAVDPLRIEMENQTVVRMVGRVGLLLEGEIVLAVIGQQIKRSALPDVCRIAAFAHGSVGIDRSTACSGDSQSFIHLLVRFIQLLGMAAVPCQRLVELRGADAVLLEYRSLVDGSVILRAVAMTAP